MGSPTNINNLKGLKVVKSKAGGNHGSCGEGHCGVEDGDKVE